MSKEAALERLFRFCTFLDCPSLALFDTALFKKMNILFE